MPQRIDALIATAVPAIKFVANRVLAGVLLMVFLHRPEAASIEDHGRDVFLRKKRIDLAECLFGARALLVVGNEDRGLVAETPIAELTSGIERIDVPEKIP